MARVWLPEIYYDNDRKIRQLLMQLFDLAKKYDAIWRMRLDNWQEEIHKIIETEVELNEEMNRLEEKQQQIVRDCKAGGYNISNAALCVGVAGDLEAAAEPVDPERKKDR